MTRSFSNLKAHMCSHPDDLKSADSLLKMCIKQVISCSTEVYTDMMMEVEGERRRRGRRRRRRRGIKVCTYNKHGRPDHFWNTLPEFSRRARFTQTPRKFPGLRVRWSSHRCAPLCINGSCPQVISTKFKGNSSPVYPSFRSTLVRTTSFELGHVAAWLLIHSHFSISYLWKVNACRIIPELCRIPLYLLLSW